MSSVASKQSILVTGGAGFIGSNFVHHWMGHCNDPIVILDKLTYAGNVQNLASLESEERYRFVRGDIADKRLLGKLLQDVQPRAVVNFAAESHVDRSIHGPSDFIDTNIVGTFQMLEVLREYWSALSAAAQQQFRFLHVSTDEVYGTLSADAPPFSETNAYAPNSPYSASKAASDHLVRAWHHTYGLPIVTSNCSNNYGPYQFPEKLIPLVILNALNGRPLPIYGDGQQIRDWLFVEDHCSAIRMLLEHAEIGHTYNVGGGNELTNLSVVKTICGILDRLRPRPGGGSYKQQIEFVEDRAGHDRRYAVDAEKIRRELGWRPAETFESGIERTVEWYLANTGWTDSVTTGDYQAWLDVRYQNADGSA